jgi:DNA-binding winged helix-turn-helix (wHTH) protein/TolB-like protein
VGRTPSDEDGRPLTGVPAAVESPDRRVYAFGAFSVDPSERLLLRHGQSIPLTPKAFDTLLVLVRNSGHLVTREELMRAVWPDTFVEEAGLTRNISVLRKALGGSDEEYIETLAKRGYRFVAEVRELSPETLRAGQADELVIARRTTTRIVAELDDAAEGVPRALPAPRSHWLSSWRGGAVVALALLGATLVVAVRDRLAARARPVRSLAVLPFRRLGVPVEEDYLGIALADALITRLGNVRMLTLRPTSEVLQYDARTVEAARAARELKVDAVLEGTIQREGERIRVTAQLVSAETGSPVWTGKFDETLRAVLAVEDSLSDSVAHALSIQLTSRERERLGRRPTENADAHQAYLQGRYAWNKRTPDALRKAIELFTRAVEIDPSYALAYAGLADTYLVIGNHQFAAPRAVYPQAKEAVLRALALDDSIGEAHASLASILWEFDWDWRAAEAEFKRALELSPSYPTAHQWYAELLCHLGRAAEAIAEIDRARALDPVSTVIAATKGFLLYLSRQHEASIVALKQTLELDPGWALAHLYVGANHVARRDYAAAAEAVGEARKALGEPPLILQSVAYVTALQGRQVEARALLDRLERVPPEIYADAYFTSAVHMALGDHETALRLLERAHDERSYWFTILKVDPGIDPLRSDPRFAALMKRVGFP